MEASLQFVPATAFSLEQFAEIFTRSFEGYFYPGTTSAPILAERARAEQLDFHRSIVMLENDAPIGQAVLGLRGNRAWCGGLGVYAAQRGRGLSHPLIRALQEQARMAGARSFGLEVLARNERAIRTYQGAGMQIRRQLHIYEWHESDQEDDTSDWPAVAVWQARPAEEDVTEADPQQLLGHHARLHPVVPAWQRELASALVRANLRGLALGAPGYPQAYVLFSDRDGTARIVDLAANDPADAHKLLEALQRRFEKVVSINEPSDSPLTPVYRACGFAETDRQHDMFMVL